MYSSHADPKIDYYRWQVAPAAPHSRGGLREAASHSHRPAGRPLSPLLREGGGGGIATRRVVCGGCRWSGHRGRH
jgi:hypothetical protein